MSVWAFPPTAHHVGDGVPYAHFGGHFAFFPYLRPFLEKVTQLDISGVSPVLMAFGAANVVGTLLSGTMIRLGLRVTLLLMPLLMALLAFCLIAFGKIP